MVTYILSIPPRVGFVRNAIRFAIHAPLCSALLGTGTGTRPDQTAHRDPGYRTRPDSNQTRNRSDTARLNRPQSQTRAGTRPDQTDNRNRNRIQNRYRTGYNAVHGTRPEPDQDQTRNSTSNRDRDQGPGTDQEQNKTRPGTGNSIRWSTVMHVILYTLPCTPGKSLNILRKQIRPDHSADSYQTRNL